MSPVRGARFKSVTIEDFDLCEACVLTTDAGGKEFLKFERPGDEGTTWLKTEPSEVLDAPLVSVTLLVFAFVDNVSAGTAHIPKPAQNDCLRS